MNKVCTTTLLQFKLRIAYADRPRLYPHCNGFPWNKPGRMDLTAHYVIEYNFFLKNLPKNLQKNLQN